ncbi:thiol-disulfide oxidoreductase DCC family protein [Tenacibaculum amylolyticum]|uniref:thiol-disulfide oxidoreductase DCC family protein n=1 Tax=Tenacibaculum amylolyticum TaxID=104269 RepID=UPI003895C46D
MNTISGGKKLILFDGVCNLCNETIIKIIKFDKKNMFLFASLQSEFGKKILNDLAIDVTQIDSIVLYEPKVAYYIKSDAALNIMNSLGGFWKLTYIFWVFPTPIRNLVYDFIAKNRYRWFGKKAQCMIPTPELKSKFLS